MSTEQFIMLSITIIGGLIATVFSLVKYINNLQAKTHQEFAASVNKALETFGARIDKLTEKMDARYDEMWKQLGALDREVEIFRERDRHRTELLEKLEKQMETRLSGMHAKVQEVQRYGQSMERIAIQLKAAAEAARSTADE